MILGSLSSDVFERRTSTGNGRFALLSRDFEQIFGQIVSVRIKTLGKINTIASRLIKRGKGSLPVDVRRSKTSLLKLPIMPYVRYNYSKIPSNIGRRKSWVDQVRKKDTDFSFYLVLYLHRSSSKLKHLSHKSDESTKHLLIHCGIFKNHSG